MKIFITGSTGMVGRNLTEALSAAGHDVITSRSSDVDLFDFGQVVLFLNEIRPEMIIHAAGKVGGIQANVKDPFGFFDKNMRMGMNIVRGALTAGVMKMINFSSSCSYPCGLDRPLSEKDIFAGKLEPTNEGYAIAKAAITRMCAFASKQFSGCSFKTLVPCNLYGRYDKFGEENSHMIPAVIRKLHAAKISGAESVTIWGDGLARREFLYAGDLAEMTVECVKRFDELPNTMNIGLGQDYTIDEYYETAARVVGYSGRFVHDITRPVGMRRKLLDVSEQEKLGIRPRHTLEEGLRATYEYYIESDWSKE